MKRLLFIVACSLLVASPSFAAKQTLTSTDTGAQSRTKLNANFTELYSLVGTRPWVIQPTAPADTTLLWFDDDQEVGYLVLKVHNGTTWVAQAVGTGGSYTLPVATASVLGGVKQGSGVSIAADGTLSATAAGIGLGTSDNPSFNSVHASGGNLAAANKQVTKAWQTGLSYTADVTSVIHGGKHWIAKTTHTAGSTTEPGVGASYTDAWTEVTGGSTDLSNYLSKTNTAAYTPAADYHPATKKYVDDAITAGGGYTDEMAQDAVGGMFSGNTETGITVTYDDANAKINAVVDFSGLVSVYEPLKGVDDNYVTDAEKTKLSNLSGTNTGDNAVNSNYSSLVTNATHTGEVTGSGALTITNGAVTLNKMANMATGSLIYRKTAGTGVPEVQTLATLKTDLGLAGTNSGDQTNITGNAVTATTLQTARTIGGVSFDGSANINLPGVNTSGNQNTSGNAGTANALAANGTNCSAGQAALGIDASGNAEGCWTPSGTGTPGGSDTQIQFNDGGSFGGDSGLTYNKTTDSLTVAGTMTAASFSSSAADGSRRSILPNNTSIDCIGGGEEEIHNDAGAIKACENNTEYDVLLSRDIGIAGGVQAYNQYLPTWPSAVDATEVGYLNGVTSAIQGQIDAKLNAASPTSTGKYTTAPSATGSAGFNIPHGTAPTSPANGDIWTTTAGFYARINGSTVGPFGSSAGLTSADIDTSAEIRAIVGDESGTGALLFAGGDVGAATATTASAGDNDTSVATTAFVQTAKKSGIQPVCMVIPAAAATADYPIFKAPAALTITAGSIHVYAIGGTNVVGGLDECTGTNGTCGSVTAVDSDITGTAGNDVSDDGTLSNAGIAAGNWIQWHTTSVSGTNTSLSVCFSYTLD